MLHLNKLIKETNGFYSIIDGMIAILLIFIAFLAFNSMINLDIVNDNSQVLSDYRTSEDLMEILSADSDDATLNQIYYILKSNNNSYESKAQVTTILSSFFDKTIPDKNYVFKVNNQIIASRGNLENFENYNSAKRTVGDYTFSLLVYR
ncbi:hypothetical protein [uncultured Methanobrevibacter sp.]|uniref:hypothetical protein n=1 Tax=uncultured Methanobrevibacter sp. TaxID=253161 RepID=UPI0025EFB257|nr:hypothetical protein [uncultured Methanobrevibacter sp.]